MQLTGVPSAKVNARAPSGSRRHAPAHAAPSQDSKWDDVRRIDKFHRKHCRHGPARGPLRSLTLADSAARTRIGVRTCRSAENLELHSRDAGAQSKRRGGGRRKIDDSAPDVRTAIVDSYPHRLRVRKVDYPDLGPQGQAHVR